MRSISWLPYDGCSAIRCRTSSGRISRRRSSPVSGSWARCLGAPARLAQPAGLGDGIADCLAAAVALVLAHGAEC